MTELEKRIEGMAKDIELSCDTNNDITVCRELNDCSMCQARYLIEKCHYRKEEEVRKEIFNKLIEVSKNFDWNLPFGVLKAWAIEFGVKVEE